MKIKNAIPPIALSALLITNVYAREADTNAPVIEQSKNGSKQSESLVSGKVNQPTELKSKSTTAIDCTIPGHCYDEKRKSF